MFVNGNNSEYRRLISVEVYVTVEEQDSIIHLGILHFFLKYNGQWSYYIRYIELSSHLSGLFSKASKRLTKGRLRILDIAFNRRSTAMTGLDKWRRCRKRKKAQHPLTSRPLERLRVGYVLAQQRILQHII